MYRFMCLSWVRSIYSRTGRASSCLVCVWKVVTVTIFHFEILYMKTFARLWNVLTPNLNVLFDEWHAALVK
jgi:hypothetical protein